MSDAEPVVLHAGLPPLVFEGLRRRAVKDRSMWGGLTGEHVRHKELGFGRIERVEDMGGWMKLVVAFAESSRDFQVRALSNGAFVAMSISTALAAELGLERELVGETVRSFCAKRGIQYLVHFTQFENLDSILAHGLLPRQELDDRVSRGDLASFAFVDTERFDGRRDASCLSISFPNYRMFFKYRQAAGQKWVVLLFDAAVLWECECAFFGTNAANNSVRRGPIADLKTAGALHMLFGDLGGNKREHLGIPDNCPTDPQAEVLVFGTISPRYIAAIHFDDWGLLRSWGGGTSSTSDLASLASHNPEWFRPRVDHPHWKTIDGQLGLIGTEGGSCGEPAGVHPGSL